MRCGDAITSMIDAIYSAAYRDFPDRYHNAMTPEAWEASKAKKPYEHLCEKRPHRPQPSDIECIAHFQQTWGSTALGFGGIGGQAVTSAYTTILYDDHGHLFAVYFGGRLAYIVKGPTDVFWEDVRRRTMAETRLANMYRITPLSEETPSKRRKTKTAE